MIDTIKSAVSSGHGNAVLYGILGGLILSDILPTPADSLYFSMMRKNKEKLIKNQITPKQYWQRDAIIYYGLNPIYWTLVAAVVIYFKGDYSQKIKLGLGIISAGAVFAVINKNIKQDEKLQDELNTKNATS